MYVAKCVVNPERVSEIRLACCLLSPASPLFRCPRGGKPANSAGSDPGMGGYRATRYPSRYPPTINEGLIPGTRYPPASIYLTIPATRYLPATKRYRVAKPGGRWRHERARLQRAFSSFLRTLAKSPSSSRAAESRA